MQEITSSGRVAVGCMMCGAPAIVSLLPTFGYVSDDRPLPRHARAVRAEDGAGDEDDDGPLGTWHMFARLQSVRGGSAVMLALQDVARLACPAFSPHRGRGGLGSTIQGNDGGRTFTIGSPTPALGHGPSLNGRPRASTAR